MRAGDWKLLRNPLDPANEDAIPEGQYLYNLSEDPGECNDLAGQYPEVVEELLAHRAGYERMVKELAAA